MVKIVEVNNIQSIIQDRLKSYNKGSMNAIASCDKDGRLSFSVLSTLDLRRALRDDNASFSSAIPMYMSLPEPDKRSFIRKIKLYAAHTVSGKPGTASLLSGKIKKLISDNKIMRVHELSDEYLGIRYTSEFLKHYFGDDVSEVNK